MLFEGIVAFPTALVNDDENPVKCTPCPGGKCPSDLDEDNEYFTGIISEIYGNHHNRNVASTEKGGGDTEQNVTPSASDYNFNEEWVNAYCVVNEMTILIQYFPYLLLLMALALCVVQKVSNK